MLATSPQTYPSNWFFSPLFLSQEMLAFLPEWTACATHSAQDQTLSPRPLPPFLALKVDTNIGTDLHPSSWDYNATSCTIAHIFSVLVPIPLLKNNLICFRKAVSSGVLWGLTPRQCFLPPTLIW